MTIRIAVIGAGIMGALLRKTCQGQPCKLSVTQMLTAQNQWRKNMLRLIAQPIQKTPFFVTTSMPSLSPAPIPPTRH